MMVAKFIAFGLNDWAVPSSLVRRVFHLGWQFCLTRVEQVVGEKATQNPSRDRNEQEDIKTEIVCRRRLLGYDVEMASRFLNPPLESAVPSQPSSENPFGRGTLNHGKESRRLA